MTTQTVSGTYGNWELYAPVTTLSITSTGYINSKGVFFGLDHQVNYTVVNEGRIVDNYHEFGPEGDGGLEGFGQAGFITNGGNTNTKALIEGPRSFGVYITAGGVSNFGSIIGSSVYQGGGSYDGHPYALSFSKGAVMTETAHITNGSSSDTKALISGGAGVFFYGSGTVTNFGTIEGLGTVVDMDNSAIVTSSRASAGVYSESGGVVTNGSSSDTRALIFGEWGVRLFGVGTVSNFGTIEGAAFGGRGGISIGGGRVTNGSSSDHGAYVYNSAGGSAVGAGGGDNSATVVNYGTIKSTSDTAGDVNAGVALYKGGRVTNGSASDQGALIEGLQGVQVSPIGAGGGAGTIVNFGTIRGTSTSTLRGAVGLYDGGVVTNGSSADYNALITGREGITVYAAAGTITNFGTIEGRLTSGGKHGVLLGDGGAVTNGSATDQSAYIGGFQSGIAVNTATGKIHNFGTISGAQAAAGQAGVALNAGGYVSNGGSNAFDGLLVGYQGVIIGGGAGTVVNFGDIRSTGLATSERGGVSLYDGGGVTNGTASDQAAFITGEEGVSVKGGAGTVTNDAVILGVIASTGKHGIYLGEGGLVTNGAANDVNALVASYQSGVAINHAVGTVRNYGAVESFATVSSQAGVSLANGGTVTNGSGADATASIVGDQGVLSNGGATSLSNYGTIKALGGSGAYGVQIADATHFINENTGLIEGYGGVELTGTATNFGVIDGTANQNNYVGEYGVLLNGGGSLTNGAANDATATITGYTGVEVTGAGALTNFGTITTNGRGAVAFENSNATLIVEAGSSIDGYVSGDGGTIVMGSGSGTITGFTGGGFLFLAGAAQTTFDDFDDLEIASGSSFKLANGATLAAGDNLFDEGALTIAGALNGAGNFVVIAGATASVTTSFTDAGTWTQTGGTTTVASGDTLTFNGTGNLFQGTLTGAGAIAFTGGSNYLLGATLSASKMVINGAAVTLYDTIDIDTQLNVTTPSLVIATAGVTLAGGGTLVLTNNATNAITGASAAATLTNAGDSITGAGQLGNGEMTLVNDAGGTIDGFYANALTINTGANAVKNAGLIESTGTGGVTITSAVGNTGTLTATKGTLTVDGAVTGAGAVDISGGTADFASAFAENVVFSASGELELAKSQSYTGTITGFSKTGATSFDLEDIDFISGTTKATYSGTSTAGTLTVTDGTHTAKIKLSGDYAASTFTVSSDGAGGTKVLDPTAPGSGQSGPASPHPFIAAMASLGAGAAGGVVNAEAWRAEPPLLSAPRVQAA